jgi:hypothetical protein
VPEKFFEVSFLSPVAFLIGKYLRGYR